jgi:hypothetical protein
MGKIFLYIIVSAAISCCTPVSKPQHANPIPRVGQQISEDYDEFFLVEENSDYTKYGVRNMHEESAFLFFVICDRQGKILSVWRVH